MIGGRGGGPAWDHSHKEQQNKCHQGPIELAEHRLEYRNLQVTEVSVSFIVRRVLFHHLEFPWPTSWKFDVILYSGKIWRAKKLANCS